MRQNGSAIAYNRAARYHYEVLDTLEAGIVLLGTEVKSLRMSSVDLKNSYAEIRGGEAWLRNASIPIYKHCKYGNHLPLRQKKLLLTKGQINKISGKLSIRGFTLVVLSIHFNPQGKVKVKIGLAKGKKLYDKRREIKKRDQDRETRREAKGIGNKE